MALRTWPVAEARSRSRHPRTPETLHGAQAFGIGVALHVGDATYCTDCNGPADLKAATLQGVKLTKKRSLKSGIVGKSDPVVRDVGQ